MTRCNNFLERCPSGRRGSPAKGVWALTPIEGSNPSFSAKNKKTTRFLGWSFYFCGARGLMRILMVRQNGRPKNAPAFSALPPSMAVGQPISTAQPPEGRGTWMCRVNPSFFWLFRYVRVPWHSDISLLWFFPDPRNPKSFGALFDFRNRTALKNFMRLVA